MQWYAGSPVTLPIESGVDDHRLRHAPCIVAEVLRQILLLVADRVTEHFICPNHFSGNCFRVRVEEKFRAVETHSVFWIVRTGDAETVQLPGADIGQKHVPDLIGAFGDRDAKIFFGRLNIVE